jgi:Carboxypeptidase regulatory-like domain
MQKSYSFLRVGATCLLLTALPGAAGAVTIKGNITDASRGTALPSIVAAAYTPTGTLQGTATSDSLGHYVLTVPSGLYRVLAYELTGTYATEFGGNADSFDTSPVVNATADTTGVNFAMEKAGVISGTVRSGGAPLSIMTVAAYNLATGTRRGFTQTAPDGTYSLGVPPGQYRVAAYDDSGTYAVSFFQNQLTFLTATTLSLVSGQQATGIDFQLALAAHISGSVVDGDTNQTLPGTTVIAYTTDGTMTVATTTTDAAGNFSLTVPPGTYKLVGADPSRVYAAGYVVDSISFVSNPAFSVAAAASVGAIRIPLHRAGVVSGHVSDGSGTPLKGISVAAYNDDGSQRTLSQTDANGAYALLLPPGEFRVAAFDTNVVFATQFFPQRVLFSNASTVSVAVAQTTPAIDFVLVRGARFSGTITDQQTGAPVGEVSVGSIDAAGNIMSVGVTDNSGNYALVVPAGGYKLAAFDNLLRYITSYGGGAPNYDTATVFEVSSDSTRHVDFAVTRGVHIAGTVIDSGAAFVAVSNVQIDALDLAGDRVASAMVHDSVFDLVLAPGTYKLLAVDPQGRFYAMFYNNALRLETANPIVVHSTGISSPITMTLTRVVRRRPVHH